uniref:DOG1 domain-containing protein n=1 Tax=Oryza brachyantha TaxID=4533 RepID=J3L498_ORYBR
MSTARHVACYQRWIAGQEASLGELEAASANAAAGRATDAELRAALERCMRGYAEYVASRRTLAREDSTALFAPPWCTSFENSVLWLGGGPPSLTIRLLYSLSGEGLEEHIEELISGAGALGAARSMGLLGITARQLEQPQRTTPVSDGLASGKAHAVALAVREVIPLLQKMNPYFT